MSVHHVEISCCTILITCVGSKMKLAHAHIHSLSIVHTHTHTSSSPFSSLFAGDAVVNLFVLTL